MQRNPLFKEKIKSISAEIELALQWRTPIIIVALYANDHVLQDAQARLLEQLSSLQQEYVPIQLNHENPNLVDLLKEMDASQAVFSVTGFEDGGGDDRADSYRFLNLHREYFIETSTRVLLWLKPDEFQKMASYAPDFWAFRHLFFDFSGNRATPKRSATFEGISLKRFPWNVTGSDPEAALSYRQKALKEMQETNETLAFRLDLQGEIAGLYVTLGNKKEAVRVLDKALRLIPDGYFEQLKAKILLGRAIIFLEDDLPLQAESLLLQAMDCVEPTSAYHVALGQARRLNGRNSEALRAVKKALRQTPKDAAAWNEVGNIRANLGHFEDSLNAYEKAFSYAADPRILINQAALLLSVGRDEEALACLQGLDENVLEMVSAISQTPVYKLLEKTCA